MTGAAVQRRRSLMLTVAQWIPGRVLLAETAVGSYRDLARASTVREIFGRLG
ncbi:hypothetical protein [Nocardia amamiensis]|uniref:hypothetical protein n=1 Tax=Nocardia amamiensis TaxID=404578 RepID=UPI00340F8E83